MARPTRTERLHTLLATLPGLGLVDREAQGESPPTSRVQPYTSSPFVVADTLDPEVSRARARLEGMAGWRVLGFGVGLAAGVVLPGQPAVVAVGFMAYALVPALLGLFPVDLAPFLPTSILAWTAGLAGGQAVGWVTPVAWAVGTGLLVVVAIRQMRRAEL